MVTPEERRAFLDERRAIARDRYDRLHAARYDENWGEVWPAHRRFVDGVLARTPPDGLVLDVACGTGKYWPQVRSTGRRLIGIDQSAGMLEVARRKYPDVPTRVVAVQDLAGQADLVGTVDALLCVDAMENVGPEDWPVVLAGFVALLRPDGIGYLTVELPEGPMPAPVDARQVTGEDVDAGYHYYPERERVRQWLADAGLAVVEEADDDCYWHLVVRPIGPR